MCRKNAFNAIFGHWMYPNPSIASALKFFNLSIIFNKKLTPDHDHCCFPLFGAGSALYIINFCSMSIFSPRTFGNTTKFVGPPIYNTHKKSYRAKKLNQ